MRPILLFTATAYALSIALSLLVGLTGGYQSALFGLRYVSMFLPAVSVLTVNAAMKEGPRVHWDRLPVLYAPPAR